MRLLTTMKNERGFTMVELLIALAMIMFVCAGTLEAIYKANVLSIEAKETTIAMNDARAVLDRIKITSLSSLPSNATVNASAIWADLGTFISNNLAQQQITITGGTGATLRQITVTVQWRSARNKLKTLQFTTMKSFLNG